MPGRLPRPDELLVEPLKLTDYLLSDRHPDGAAKARFFASVGFALNRWAVLEGALIEHGRTREIVQRSQTPYGTKYLVECALITPDGRNLCIRSVWIAETGKPPRLVTAYPASR